MALALLNFAKYQVYSTGILSYTWASGLSMEVEETLSYSCSKHFSWQCSDHFSISLVLQEMRGSCHCSHSIPNIMGSLGEFVIRKDISSEFRLLVTEVVKKRMVPSLIGPPSIVLIGGGY